MKTYALLSALIASVSTAVLFTSTPGTAEAAPTKAQAAAPLIVAELFTSQSCSSCPPAEALFSGNTIQNTLSWRGRDLCNSCSVSVQGCGPLARRGQML